jgi:hypothetical protein
MDCRNSLETHWIVGHGQDEHGRRVSRNVLVFDRPIAGQVNGRHEIRPRVSRSFHAHSPRNADFPNLPYRRFAIGLQSAGRRTQVRCRNNNAHATPEAKCPPHHFGGCNQSPRELQSAETLKP